MIVDGWSFQDAQVCVLEGDTSPKKKRSWILFIVCIRMFRYSTNSCLLWLGAAEEEEEEVVVVIEKQFF